jgi:hypothetical protein
LLRFTVRVRALASFVLLFVTLGFAQQQSMPPGATPFPSSREGRSSAPGAPPPMSPEQMRKYNDQRYQRLKSDTENLLRLTTELKQAVDKANSSTLSLDVIKKTEQIEKLAKSVREKMKAY